MSAIKFAGKVEQVTFTTCTPWIARGAPWTAMVWVGKRTTSAYARWARGAKPHEILDEMLWWNANEILVYSQGRLIYGGTVK